MPTKKYYAVRDGRETGVFDTWAACKNSIDGYPNADYRSFASRELALSYVYGDGVNGTAPPGLETTAEETDEPTMEAHGPDEVVAYIDGSYNDKLKRFSYAVVLFTDNQKMTISDAEDNPDTIEMRNVAGELKAAMHAMRFAAKRGKKRLKLYYDYTGIEMWATGRWKTKQFYTRAYAEYAQKMRRKLQIIFIKVKSHSGNVFNDEADKLAKEALTKGCGQTDQDTAQT